MEQTAAETLALSVLGWLLQDGDLTAVFLGSTGISPSDLRAAATQPEFLAGVLDFVLMDDDWVRAAARNSAVAPEDLTRARAALPGGDAPFWT